MVSSTGSISAHNPSRGLEGGVKRGYGGWRTTWAMEICVHQGASFSSTGSMLAHMSFWKLLPAPPVSSEPKGDFELEPNAPFLGGDLNAFCMGFFRLDSSAGTVVWD